jgi:hypothetical protein
MGPIIAASVVALAMVGTSVWGAVTLPPGARVPVHRGLGGYNIVACAQYGPIRAAIRQSGRDQ